MTQRKGKTLKTLPDGDRRRMSDGKNAWRKMSDSQREEFMTWVFAAEDGRGIPNLLGNGGVLDRGFTPLEPVSERALGPQAVETRFNSFDGGESRDMRDNDPGGAHG